MTAARGLALAFAVVAGCGGADESPVVTAEQPVVAEAPAAEPEVTAPPVSTEPPADEVTDPPAGPVDDLFPVVVAAEATQTDELAWTVSVTMTSGYDTPERYADAWRVLDADDNELGVRVLTHDHADEQPFTRSTGVDIPADIDVVFVEGRDQLNGWNGQRFELSLDRD